MKKKYVYLICLLLIIGSVKAQFSAYNLMEYQYGKLPDNNEDSFSSIYDRFMLNYSLQKFKAGITLENFYSPIEDRNYTRLSQFKLQYKTKSFDIKAGHFYETIGRGLLLRSFEIPGAILEDLSYRSRHYFHKDIRGVSAKYRYKSFSLKVLYGNPLNYLFPPTFDDDLRRPDEVAAITTEYGFLNQTLGVSVMQLKNDSPETMYYNSLNLSGLLFSSVSYYAELAHNINKGNFLNLNDDGAYGFYLSLSSSFGNLGMSLELKEYNNFLIGSGINEPPALVKEHAYRLLNRSTHVLQPTNEKGYQLELFYSLSESSILTFNITRAENNFEQKYVFEEYFLEYSTGLADKHDLKLFIDYAKDPFKQEEKRITTGMNSQWMLTKTSGINLDYEYQNFKRFGSNVTNQLLSVGMTIKSKFSCNLILERSNDPFLLNDNESNRTWLGTNFNYKINSKHQIQLFAGNRRGGPACNSGICYEVLDFKGVELRISSRF